MSTFVCSKRCKMKIIADKTVPFLRGIMEPVAEVVYLAADEFTAGNVKDADALIVRSINKCTRELLQGSRVRLITSATIGFDHIDTRYCDEAGICWKNAPGCNALSVAQYVLSCLIAVAQRTKESLQGKTIGIVGVGNVGKEVERICSVYGMQVLRNDPPRAEEEGAEGFVSLETIAREADIITLHTPLTNEGRFATRHLAGKDFFDALERKPWLVNAARGAVIDTEALIAAKRTGKVGEVIVDCWENEPVISRDLLADAAMATPHIAGFSADGKANGTRRCLEHIAAFFQIAFDRIAEVKPPEPLHPVIDLAHFGSNRTDQAILSCFHLYDVDSVFRENPGKFEWFRANYNHPREFEAYAVLHANREEAALLSRLGFRILS